MGTVPRCLWAGVWVAHAAGALAWFGSRAYRHAVADGYSFAFVPDSRPGVSPLSSIGSPRVRGSPALMPKAGRRNRSPPPTPERSIDRWELGEGQVTIEKLGGLVGAAAAMYPVSLLVTGVLDGLFGFFPDHPFLDDGWVWFLKPAFWTILIMSIYRHAHERGKIEALIELYQAAKGDQRIQSS